MLENDGNVRIRTRNIRVCIVDVQQLWRAVYRMALQRQPDIEVVCSSGSTHGSSLAAAVVAHSPNVLLVGVRILRPADVKRLKQIAQKHPRLGVVALYRKRFTGTDTEDGVVGGREACVFMHRGEVDTAEQLDQVIRTVVEVRESAAAGGAPSNGHSLQTDAEASWRYSALPA